MTEKINKHKITQLSKNISHYINDIEKTTYESIDAFQVKTSSIHTSTEEYTIADGRKFKVYKLEGRTKEGKRISLQMNTDFYKVEDY